MFNQILLVLSTLVSVQCRTNIDLRQATRIGSGSSAEPNARPFQVALYKKVGPNGELGFCGGALVAPDWVLTAAHCCFHDGRLVDDVQAILGAHSLYSRYENGRRIVSVAEIIVHPDFDPQTFANDIALMRLANTVQVSDSIKIIALPYANISSFNFAGMAAIVSGWGIVAPEMTFLSPRLRVKSLAITTDTLCNSYYLQQLPTNTICAVANSGGSLFQGTCKGDNGGPLTIFYNATEEDILVGVASFVGIDGCTVSRPSVFTRVQRYLPWIRSVTGL